jgi:glycosyltransferase involved in cell wall biosynthesis
VSHGVADDVAAEIGIPLEKITTIYNPVLTPDLHDKMKEPPDHPWLLDNGSPIVLAAGRLTEQKDYPTLLRAFSRLSSQRPCRLIILGTETSQSKLRRLVQTLKLEDQVSRSKLETLVQTLKLEDRVSFPGWTENPFAFMSRASLFVLSSRYEGLPGVLVQALACGCPCVSTDCPAGPAEILQDGKLGPLVPVGDEAALAEAMGQILDQPPDRQMLQQRVTFFSVERAVDAYEQLITSFAT